MLYQFLPRLSDDEYASLEASIREHGIQVPILVDENKSIIDGHHRHEIAERLGIECPRRFAIDLSDEQKRTLALSLNVDRRHLTRDQRRQLVESSLKADPHLSDRQHAERTGVSPTTVGARRSELEAAGLVSNLDTRTGKDGVEQPSTKAPAPDLSGEAESGSGQTSVESDADTDREPTEAASSERVDCPPPAAPPVTGIDGKTYQRPRSTPKPIHHPQEDEWTAQDRAEELARNLSRNLSLLYALVNPERRAEYIATWHAGIRDLAPLGSDFITPKHMRELSAALLDFATEWENADV